jgi:hypothetical protein
MRSAELSEQGFTAGFELPETGMCLEPGPESEDFRLLRRGPALAMDHRAIEVLDLATRIGRASVTAKQAAGRHERLGAGGLEHDAKS